MTTNLVVICSRISEMTEESEIWYSVTPETRSALNHTTLSQISKFSKFLL